MEKKSSLATVLCAVLGTVPAMMFTRMTHRGRDILLAFTAGIMVSASTYGLIPSALKLSNLFVLSVGILLGTAVLLFMERYVPHEDPSHAAAEPATISGSFFFLIAMVLHNLPEGFLTALFLVSRGMK